MNTRLFWENNYKFKRFKDYSTQLKIYKLLPNVEIIFTQDHTYVLPENKTLKYGFVTLRCRYKEKQISSIVHLPI